MDINLTRNTVEKNLLQHISILCSNNDFKEVYTYALFPPGKLFRPLLVMGLYEDFHRQNPSTLSYEHPYALLASALEIHHTYTLIHDDLPAMDNDDYRRGRLTTHKKFGQWQAILAADGLLNASYHLIAKIPSHQASNIIKIISHLLGPKGLIQGQVIDLSLGTNKNFNQILRMHELKTARLLQCALIGSYLLSDTPTYRISIDLLKMGKYLGLVFQFLDDLSELSDENLSQHESNINPWINHPDLSSQHLLANLDRMIIFLKEYQLPSLTSVIFEYLHKMKKLLTLNKNKINHHLKNNDSLIPIMDRLEIVCNRQDLA